MGAIMIKLDLSEMYFCMKETEKEQEIASSNKVV